MRSATAGDMNHQPSAVTTRAGRALLGSWLTAALSCLGVVVPKCPLCAAAYLGLFGVSASSAQAVVELGVPLCVALIASSTLATAWFLARRSRRVAVGAVCAQTCCGGGR